MSLPKASSNICISPKLINPKGIELWRTLQCTQSVNMLTEWAKRVKYIWWCNHAYKPWQFILYNIFGFDRSSRSHLSVCPCVRLSVQHIFIFLAKILHDDFGMTSVFRMTQKALSKHSESTQSNQKSDCVILSEPKILCLVLACKARNWN